METNGKTFTRQCECGGWLESIDANGLSRTARCVDCGHCSLIIRGRHQIKLRDFHLKRGKNGGRPLADLTMAKRLVNAIAEDEWPSPAASTDFGIIDSRHLGALQFAVRAGVSAYDLDRVLGDGPAITELVRKVSPENAYRDVSFETVWDKLPWPNDAGDDESEAEDRLRIPDEH